MNLHDSQSQAIVSKGSCASERIHSKRKMALHTTLLRCHVGCTRGLASAAAVLSLLVLYCKQKCQ